MLELETIRARIRENPSGAAEQTLHQLIIALETRGAVDVARLYDLDYDTFKLALDLMSRWWLLRYAGDARNGMAAHPVYVDLRGTKEVARA